VILTSTAFLRLARALPAVAFVMSALNGAAPLPKTPPRDTVVQHTSTVIDDLPGWSAWKAVTGTGKIEFRSRLFNATVKPGCGVEFRVNTPQTGYTVDATIARSEEDVSAPASGTLEMLGTPVIGAFSGQYAHGSIPLHFTLFPDGRSISYFDLHWEDCDSMRVFVRSIEPYHQRL
jgi:hypothetical protein